MEELIFTGLGILLIIAVIIGFIMIGKIKKDNKALEIMNNRVICDLQRKKIE